MTAGPSKYLNKHYYYIKHLYQSFQYIDKIYRYDKIQLHQRGRLLMKSNIRKRLITLISIAFIIYFIYVIFSQQPRIDMLMAEKQEVQEKIEEQDLIYNQLQYYFEIAGTDEYIELIARSRLGYVKPNDIVFIDLNK